MKSYLLPLIVLSFASACTKAPDTKTESQGATAMKMAEVSELAQLMKSIHSDAKQWRNTLSKGEMVEADGDIFRLLTESTPTNAHVKGPVFEGFSAHYQEQLNIFLEANSVDLAIAQYNNLVTACVQCHQSYCTGPIPTIEKLYIKD